MQAKDRLLFLDSDGTHFNTLTLDKSPIAITKASLEVKVNYCWAIHSNDIALQIAKLIQSKFNAYLGYFKHRKCSQEVYKNIKPQTVIAIILHLATRLELKIWQCAQITRFCFHFISHFSLCDCLLPPRVLYYKTC